MFVIIVVIFLFLSSEKARSGGHSGSSEGVSGGSENEYCEGKLHFRQLGVGSPSIMTVNQVSLYTIVHRIKSLRKSAECTKRTLSVLQNMKGGRGFRLQGPLPRVHWLGIVQHTRLPETE